MYLFIYVFMYLFIYLFIYFIFCNKNNVKLPLAYWLRA